MRGIPSGMPGLILLGLLALPPRAHGLELFGITLFGGDDDTGQVEVIDPQPYDVAFTVDNASDELTEALIRSSALWTDRQDPASGAAGLITKARGDYRALLAQLYANARYGGAISIRINGQEAADLSLTTELGDLAKVEIRIDPGPSFLFGEVDIRNAPPLPVNRDPFDLTGRERLTTGRPASADILAASAEEMVDGWRQRGYPVARIAGNTLVADHVTNTLDVAIDVDPGRKAVFGPVAVTGATQVDPVFIRYIADIPPGVTFSPPILEEARDRVVDLGAFRGVRIREAESVEGDGTIPVEIEVVPRKPRRFGFGATLSSLEGIGLEAFWLHRNLAGRAQRLRFDGAISGIGTESDVQDLDYLVGASYRVPGFVGPRTHLELATSAEQNVFETYTEQSVGARVGLTRKFGKDLDTSVFADLTYSEIEDDLGDRSFLVFSVPLSATLDLRDDVLEPKTGFYLSGELKPFYNIDNSTTGLRATLDARTYIGFARRRGILALRGKLGSVLGPDLDQVSPDDLFFAGGGGSVRGYGYRSVGVETPSGIVGGRSSIEMSVEARYQFRDNLGLVLFTDGALVSDSTIPSGETDLIAGAGAGIRYYTGIGPLRFDIATPLVDRPGDASIAFYVGIGQAF